MTLPSCALVLAAFAAGACSGSTTPSGGDNSTSSGGTTSSSSGGTSGTSSSGVGSGTPGTTSLTGSLATLGAVQPTMSSLWISNSGETLVYLSTAPITCQQLTESRWLGGTAKGAQVFELVIKGAPKVTEIAVPPGEVNYAEGGKSSSYEVNAKSGKISFSKADAKVVEGTVSATYAGGNVSGSFHAEFCTGGQDW